MWTYSGWVQLGAHDDAADCSAICCLDGCQRSQLGLQLVSRFFHAAEIAMKLRVTSSRLPLMMPFPAFLIQVAQLLWCAVASDSLDEVGDRCALVALEQGDDRVVLARASIRD